MAQFVYTRLETCKVTWTIEADSLADAVRKFEAHDDKTVHLYSEETQEVLDDWWEDADGNSLDEPEPTP
jgi:hypothetical protein